MSTLRPVGPVAFENSRGQTAPKNRLAKDSGTNPREIYTWNQFCWGCVKVALHCLV